MFVEFSICFMLSKQLHVVSRLDANGQKVVGGTNGIYKHARTIPFYLTKQ